MLIPHKGHTDTIQVYSVTVMTHVKALQAGHSSQGTSEPITPALATGNCRVPIRDRVTGALIMFIASVLSDLLGSIEKYSVTARCSIKEES